MGADPWLMSYGLFFLNSITYLYSTDLLNVLISNLSNRYTCTQYTNYFCHEHHFFFLYVESWEKIRKVFLDF